MDKTVEKLRQEYAEAVKRTTDLEKRMEAASRVWEAAQEAHQDACQAEDRAWTAYRAAKKELEAKNDTQD